jgi:DNA-directed RNA polymerase alpha subunit
MKEKHPILTRPVNELAISDEFLEMARKNHFNNLEDIVKVPVYELVKLPYSGYRILNELIVILKGYGLDSVLIED